MKLPRYPEEFPDDDDVPAKRDVKPTRCPLPDCETDLKSEHQDRLANVTDSWLLRCPIHGEINLVLPLVDDPEPYLKSLETQPNSDPSPRQPGHTQRGPWQTTNRNETRKP